MTETHSEILPHLPFLRRYARALTGAQEAGDLYVRLSLESLLADPGTLPVSDNPRRELYRLFHRARATVEDLGIDAEPVPGPAAGPIEKRLASLDPAERRLLLLTTLEDFNIDDAAYILDIDRDIAETKIQTARAEMQRQKPTRVLIIEDEAVIALSLADLVKTVGHDVIGIAATKNEAVALAAKSKPGLVLADIRLLDGSSGLDAVHDILRTWSVPVVFITAYPERLLTGQRPEPTFLITKPFQPSTVLVTISQALLSVEAGAKKHA